MSTVQFEEETFKPSSTLGKPVSSSMVKALLSMGAVNNEQQAKYLLLGIAIICFLIATYISYTLFFVSSIPKISPDQEQHAKEFLDRVQQGRSSVIPTR
jgi:hypothetical protein